MAEINVKVMCSNAQVKLEEIGAETEKQFQLALGDAVAATFAEGKRLASERLHTTRQDWLKAYQMYTLKENNYHIQLKDNPDEKHGLKPTMIEGGFAAFDMKNGLLHGPRAKMGKNGPYNTVPFEHATEAEPRDLASAIKQQGLNAVIKEKKWNKTVMDSPGMKYSKGNYTDINQNPNGNAIQGKVGSIRTGAKYNQISEKTRRIMGQQAKHLDGLTRYQKTYENKTESRFMTFRRVSKNSPQSAWQHPGFAGAHIFQTLEMFLRQKIDKLINDILR